MNEADVGTYWTSDGEDIWQMITFCEFPTATLINLKTGEKIGGAVGSPNLKPFIKLDPSNKAYAQKGR
mgnify:FL=1